MGDGKILYKSHGGAGDYRGLDLEQLKDPIGLVDPNDNGMDQTTSKAIGYFCGGWVETEEETLLRNHLKWARIKVEGNGSRIPKELWTETTTRYSIGEERKENPFTQPTSRIYPEGNTRAGGDVSRKSHGEPANVIGSGPTMGPTPKTNIGQPLLNLNLGLKPTQPLKHPSPAGNIKKPKNFIVRGTWRGIKEGEESDTIIANDTQETEQKMQLQQIHEAEPVNIQLPISQEDIKTETLNWIDERKSQLDKKGPGKPVSTQRAEELGKTS
ncbi:hypothetical protein H5410_000512 [Solanum commersonii]|uniref:Uncharacterized protein n=1 Tax=Solanum commersonii TaxID=4109 RepID=A0A9J6AX49_SOLCO|nr:hypothetical protein H5410_000512 [Solanum commersonii]